MHDALRVIALTAGKGGVGKTTLAINLAVAYAKQNKKVLLFDADLGLANIDVLLGIRAKRNISHVLAGESSLAEVCITGPEGITIIPAASGVQKMAELNMHESRALIHAFSELAEQVDILIVDTAAGISSQVLSFANASQDIVVVVCNDPASIADSYALIKLLHQRFTTQRFGVVANKVNSMEEGQFVFNKLQKISEQFMSLNLHYLGCVPKDDYVSLAARHQRALLEEFPGATAAQAVLSLRTQITQWEQDDTSRGSIAFFLERFIQPNREASECAG
jgi:flagellar biosynthesis protein FlhG